MSNAQSVVARQLGAPVLDGTLDLQRMRGGRYGEAMSVPVFPDMKAAADEGSFYTATTFGTVASIGTPSATTPATFALSQTAPLLSLTNKAGIGGPRTSLAYLRLIVVAAGSTYTAIEMAVQQDIVPRATVGASSTLLPLANANQDAQAQGSVSTVIATPTTTAPSAAVRSACRTKVRAAIALAGDEFLFVFGARTMAGALAGAAGSPARYVIPCPPVVIGPGGWQSAFFHLWFVAFNTGVGVAPTFELELGIIER